MSSARSVLALAATIALLPWASRAVPLDVSDPTLRTVLVEFEISSAPDTVGATFSAPLPATYAASGNTGTLSMPGATYESVVDLLDYFGFPLIPSTSDDFELSIDLTTLAATAQPMTFQVDIDVQGVPQQTGIVTRSLGTDATAGFVFVASAPGVPVFCTSDPPAPFPPCTLVPGSAYDPATGLLNAVGSDALVAPDVSLTAFSRAGDLRLSEIPEPVTALLLGSGFLALALRARPGGLRDAQVLFR